MIRGEQVYRLPIEKFLGLNITSDSSFIKRGESPFMKNFSITDGYAIKKRDGYKRLYSFNGNTRAMMMCDGMLFMAVANDIFLCTLPFDGNVKCVGNVADSENCFFMRFAGEVYLWGGGKIQVYRGGSFTQIEPYRPLIAVSCLPESGAGSPLEGVNMLCTKVRKQYSPSSGNRTFVISSTPIKSVDYVKVNGEVIPPNSYNASQTGVVMEVGGAVSEGVNSVEIGYTLPDSDASRENYDKVVSCKYHMFYGGENDTKVFLWGNDSFPDARIWSQAAEGMPSAVYFPEQNYTRIGDGEKICDIVRHYDRQLIFCESSAYISYIESGEDILGRRIFSFPVRTISDTKGSAVCAQTRLIENSPVTLARDGLYKWISTAQRDERNAVKISGRIDKALLKEDISSARMFDCEHKGELYVYFPNGKVYVYCYRKDVFTLYDGIFAHTFASDAVGNVYFCDKEGGLFVFCDTAQDDGRSIECEWQSGYLDMDYEGRKNMYGVSLVYYPHPDTHFTLQWCGDDGGSSILCDVCPNVTSEITDPANTAPDAFCHGGSLKSIRKRMRTKRFRHMKLIIKDSGAQSRVHIYRLTINGRYTDI